MKQGNRTTHQVDLKGRTADDAIGQALSEHRRGRGKRLAHRQRGADYDPTKGDLASNAEKWFKAKGERIPFSKGEATEEGQDFPLTAKGRAALEAGGREIRQKNGARVIINKRGRIVQHLRSPTRGRGGRFTPDVSPGEISRRQNLKAARAAVASFFPENFDPSTYQVQAVWEGYTRAAKAKGWELPDDLDATKL